MSKRLHNDASANRSLSNAGLQSENFSQSVFKNFVVLRSAIFFAALVVILAGIKAASTIVTPVLLALFITILLLVPLRWLYAKGCPSLLAFGIVGGVILLLFLVLGWIVSASLRDFIKHSPEYSEKIVKNLETTKNQLKEYGLSLEFGLSLPDSKSTKETNNEQKTQDSENINDPQTEQLPLAEETPEAPTFSKFDSQTFISWVTWSAKRLQHFLENTLLILIILMFMIFEAARFPAKLAKAFGNSPITNEHFRQIADDVRRYIVYKGMINLLSCTVVAVFYYIIGVKYALLWGLIAFFLYFIPNIGAMVSAIPPLLLIFIDNGLPGVLTLVIGLFVIESLIGYGLEPRLLGHGLGISTVVVFLSLIFWGWLLGPIGLFLAAPLTIVVKIVLQAFDETRWMAILLDEKIPN
ncbi:MAG: AI-2E family transporter [Planctomycetaceae bacterium]|jgi:predicted PurR-regulated permease PerM|nr:AI-2E family transporter [Planctomycetaceae bacterium]